MSAVAEKQQASPAPEPDPQEDRDSSPGDGSRPYVVLEECPDLAALVLALLEEEGVDLEDSISPEALGALRDVAVFRRLGVFEARNSEHALRRAAKTSYADDTGEFELVSVSEKMWRPLTVRVRATQTVAIG